MSSGTVLVWFSADDRVPTIDGWAFIGVAKTSGGGMMLHGDVPERHRADPHYCDHCQTNRARKITVFLRQESTGSVIRVGKGCLKDFFGKVNVNGRAEYLELWDSLDEYEKWNCTDEFLASDGGVGWSPTEMPARLNWMRCACMAIEEHGFIGSRPVVDGIPSWMGADELYMELRPELADGLDADGSAFGQKIMALTDKVMAWVGSLPDGDHGDSTQYYMNLHTALSDPMGVIGYGNKGIAASAFRAYEIMQDRQREADRTEREVKPSEHFGEVKRREDFTLTVVGSSTLDSYYGVTTVVQLEDPAGNRAVWFASGYRSYHEGVPFTVRATVKKHGEFRGECQTVLTRCAFPDDAIDDEI